MCRSSLMALRESFINTVPVIVGQVTPDMLSGMTYGTYIFFGLITFGGAIFVWLFVPETKTLSLEEMDLVFGSVGTAAADQERMRQINREVGLEDLLRAHGLGAGSGAGSPHPEKETREIVGHEKANDA